jgi:23S rRNA (cytosine1962-C5)-methyltransferase
MSTERLYTTGWEDYELIDAGGGKKLERWGTILTIRPEVQAYFKSEKTFKEWEQLAHWEFVQRGGKSGVWKPLKKNVPKKWAIGYEQLTFHLELTKFKHLGLFPEQRVNWDFIKSHLNSEDKFLNLFAYTGAASCMARYCAAETLHVDSVKQLISWARENMESSRLLNIKWVLEDALKFAAREQKRGNKYKGIIMDPPAWGLGVKGEKWKLEEKIDELMSSTADLLETGGFLIMNTYSPTLDLPMIQSLAEMYFTGRTFEVRELWMKTTTGKDLYFGNVLRVGATVD